MKTNGYVLLLAVGILGAVALVPWSGATERAVALGAVAGLVGGHLNGRMNEPAVKPWRSPP